MNDVTPPKKRSAQPKGARQPSGEVQKKTRKASSRRLTRSAPNDRQEMVSALPESIDVQDAAVNELSLGPERSRFRWIGRLIMVIFVLCVIVLPVGVFFWYQNEQRPVDVTNKKDIRVVIDQGMTPEQIGARLDEQDLIKSRLAFDWYLRVTRMGNNLQAGVYSLSQSMSLSEIVDHLRTGKTDTFRITFLPGATVADNKKAFLSAGFSKSEVEEAFKERYNHTILKSKPATADLEGYIYGETYEFPSDATVKQILMRTFDELEKVIATYNLQAEYRKRGLTLYEGITLASIIQKEERDADNQRRVSQVFNLRLKRGMPLGSDPTYQYIADKQGVTRDPGIDSPYNTRKYAGLPPGPISSPGKTALIAVARPVAGDYLYFLSGDDDQLYFGRTLEEHERNIQNHCQKKCQIL